MKRKRKEDTKTSKKMKLSDKEVIVIDDDECSQLSKFVNHFSDAPKGNEDTFELKMKKTENLYDLIKKLR